MENVVDCLLGKSPEDLKVCEGRCACWKQCKELLDLERQYNLIQLLNSVSSIDNLEFDENHPFYQHYADYVRLLMEDYRLVVGDSEKEVELTVDLTAKIIRQSQLYLGREIGSPLLHGYLISFILNVMNMADRAHLPEAVKHVFGFGVAFGFILSGNIEGEPVKLEDDSMAEKIMARIINESVPYSEMEIGPPVLGRVILTLVLDTALKCPISNRSASVRNVFALGIAFAIIMESLLDRGEKT